MKIVNRPHGVSRKAVLTTVIGLCATALTFVSSAGSVTVGTATTNFDIDPMVPLPVSPFTSMVAPGVAPATDWSGTGLQAAPNLVVYGDLNYTGPATVPTNLTDASIQANCAAATDDKFGTGDKINDHPIPAIIGSSPADKADICQVFTAYESSAGSGGTDIMFYLGVTTLGNAGSTASVTLWYELNQVDDVADAGPYRSVGDILIGWEYVGNKAGTTTGYRWDGSGWDEVTFAATNVVSSTPSNVSFAEMAINLTNTGLLDRPTDPNSCKSFVAGRGMTSAAHVTTSAGKDMTRVYKLTNAVSNCGQLRITKQTLPPDPNAGVPGYPTLPTPAHGTFGVQATGGPAGATTLNGVVADDTTAGFVEIFGGNYTVRETSLPSSQWGIVSFNCTKAGVTVGTPDLANSRVTGLVVDSTPTDCTVTNAKKSALTIKKTSSGPTGDFDFNLYLASDMTTPLSGSPLTVSTTGTNPTTNAWPDYLSAGNYVLKEVDPSPSHLLTTLTCTVTKGDGSANVVTSGNQADGVAFAVAAGDQVACEAFNKGDLTITINKLTTPAGGTGFGFTSSSTPATFTLDDGDQQVFTVNAGTYTFTENAVAGYRLTDIECVGTDPANVTVDVTARSVVIDGKVGEDIECEFTNEKLARVSVTKTLEGVVGTWSFDFSLSPAGSNTNPRAVTNTTPTTTWIDLVPGSYTMTEVNLPAGFEAGTLTCGAAGGAATAGVTFTLTAGQELACTADNTELGSLQIVKQTRPATAGSDFAFTSTGLTPATFDLADDEAQLFDDLAPGTYVVDETTLTGWTLSSVVCTGAADSVVTTSATGVSVDLSAGEDVVCTFTNDKTPRLRVVKSVTNDNGGDAVPTDFTLAATPLASVTHNVYNNVVVGTEYTVSESALAGYTQTGISCVHDATSSATGAIGTVTGTTVAVTLSHGHDVTCTIVNDDIAPTIQVIKTVNNTFGGTALPDDFDPAISTIGTVLSGATTSVSANTNYTISETLIDGYAFTSIACVSGATALTDTDAAPQTYTVNLNEGQNAVCTIVNTEIQPKLTVVKAIENDNGGNAAVADFPLFITPAAGAPIGVTSEQATNVSSNVAYTVSETLLAGYTQKSIACVETGTTNAVGSAGVVTLSSGDDVTCTITNNDIAPKLTVVKDVLSEHGGNAEAENFPLAVTPEGELPLTFVTGVQQVVDANTEYSVSEDLDAVPGYRQVSIECVDDVTDDPVGTAEVVTLNEGQNVTCTVTNEDLPPKLTVVKIVDNLYGGDAVATDFAAEVTPAVNGGVVAFETQYDVSSNIAYTVGESMISGYEQSTIECTDDADGVTVLGTYDADADQVDGLTLAEGQAATCRIVNTDIAPTLRVVKSVVDLYNNDEVPTDFVLNVAGFGDVTSGAVNDVESNVEYVVSESLVDGYVQTSFECVDDVTGDPVGTFDAETVALTLDEGQDVTCTIVNTPEVPTITVIKTVNNTFGGTAVADDFDLTIAPGGVVLSGVVTEVDANTAYTISEAVLVDGYEFASIDCVEGLTAVADGDVDPETYTVTLDEGQDVVCVIVNDEIEPKLTVRKVVVSNDGGNAVVGDFPLFITPAGGAASSVTHEVAVGVLTGTAYAVSETTLDGYKQTSIACVETGTTAAVGAAGVVTLGSGDDVTCTITNDDIAPSIRVVKTVNNLAGGAALPDDFDPAISSVGVVLSGSTTVVDANAPYTISETMVDGYRFVSIECLDGATVIADSDAALQTYTISLSEGQDVVCTIVNEEIVPKLTVVKSIDNGDGGNAIVGDFPLFITPAAGVAQSVVSGTATVVSSDVAYTVSETALAGYTQTSIVCRETGTTTVVGTAGVVTLGSGDDVTCTITNDDVAPKLTVIKDVLNPNGGNANPADFPLAVTPAGGSPVTFVTEVQQSVSSNIAYSVSEDLGVVPGYRQLGIECVDDATGDPVGTDEVVTLNEGQNVTCTVTNEDLPPKLTIIKTVDAQNGGDEIAADFPLSVTPSIAASVVSGTQYDVRSNAAYTVGEDLSATPGWEQTSIECVDDADSAVTIGVYNAATDQVTGVTLAEGQAVTCTITNTDLAPRITVIKNVDAQFGGDALPDDFSLQITGFGPVASGTSNIAESNIAYTVSETMVDGYEFVSIECVDDTTAAALVDGDTVDETYTVTLDEGVAITCTIENKDLPPTITVIKTVNNTYGGAAESDDFLPSVSGIGVVVSGATTEVRSDTSYTVSETMVDGYEFVSIDCVEGLTALTDTDSVDETFTVAPVEGQDVVCVIVNDEIEPKLTVVKSIDNGDGGNAVVADFPLFITPAGGAATSVTSGVANGVSSNLEYTVSETLLDGYTQTSIACVETGTAVTVGAVGVVTLGSGDDVTCAITNNDIAPTLTVIKTVNNSFGGTAVPADFRPSVSGLGVVVSGASTTVNANVAYTISETQLDGYSLTSVSCVDADGALTDSDSTASTYTVTLKEGQDATCTLVNTEIQPKLTVVKQVITDNGGDAVIADFPLAITPAAGTAQVVASGAANDVRSNVAYTVSETQLVGYTQTSIVCVETGTAIVVGSAGVLTLASGDDVTCTIINDDIAPKLTVIKQVDNNAGGDAEVGNFPLQVTWSPQGALGVTSGVANTMRSNVEYNVEEDLGALSGYRQVSIECVDDNDATVTFPIPGAVMLNEGQEVTCTIVNEDIPPRLTVVKVVTNDDGGNAVVSDFALSVAPAVTQTAVTSGTQYVAVANRAYTISENLALVPGYTQVSIECVDDSAPTTPLVLASPGVVALTPGQDVTCTITNDDIAPTLTVVKEVINDNGSTAVVADFTLTITGIATVTSGVANTVDANTDYTVGEVELPGYVQTGIACTDDDTEATVAHTAGRLRLSEGQNVTCVITNNDNPKGSITITKRTSEESTTKFDFEIEGLPFELAGGDTMVFDDLDPGTYTIEELVENLPAGWRFTSIDCVEANGPANSTTEPSLDVVVAVGSEIDCEINNEYFDLTISKRDIADPVAVTGTVTYELEIDNVGSAAALDDATVVDELPLPLVWADDGVVSAPSGVTCDAPVGQRLTCTIPAELLGPNDDSVLITVAAEVPSDADSDTLTNVAVVDTPDDPCPTKDDNGDCTPVEEDCTSSTARTTRPLGADDGLQPNVDCETTTITPLVDLRIDKAFNGTSILAGGSASFTLVVRNAGPGIAREIVATDPVPAPLIVTGATSTIGDCGFTGNAVTCERDLMAVNEEWKITVNVRLPLGSTLPANYINVAEVKAPGDDDPDNNEDDAPVPSTPKPQLPPAGADPHGFIRGALMLVLFGGVLAIATGRRRRYYPVCVER